MAMMSAFAPALVALNDRKPLQALLESFRACLRNWRPGLLFWLSIVVLGIAVGLAVGLMVLIGTFVAQIGVLGVILVALLAIAGTLALYGLMLAIVLGSHYAAYREIFFGASSR